MHEPKRWNAALTLSAALFCLLLSTCPAAHAQNAPRYQYDSTWPKELPNQWTMEEITGMFVDKDDHIWVLDRPRGLDKSENFAMLTPPTGECCVQPPAVLEFDTAGNLLKSWSIPGSVPGWPSSEHTIFLDKAGNVWIGGAGAGDTLLKFTNDGKFISDWGHRGPAVPPGQKQQQNNQQTDLLLRGVAAAHLDDGAHELYIADGYLNKRVVVFDSDTGAFKRGWGAYGIPLSAIDNDPAPEHDPSGSPPKQFRPPVHCVQISVDGLVYICDRGGDRIQVFTKQGTFVKEFFVANRTLERGSAGSVSFSADPQQKYIFVADIMNNVIWILNRSDGAVAGKIGHMGRAGGQFHWVHIAVTDSRGNVYTGEVETGKRIQKFIPLH
jgi:DNA-binding beta-propeller fold protein YncE